MQDEQLESSPFNNLADFLKELMSREGSLTSRLESMRKNQDESCWDVHRRGIRYYEQSLGILHALGLVEDIEFYLVPARDTLLSPEKDWYREPPVEIPRIIVHSLCRLAESVNVRPKLPVTLSKEEIESLYAVLVQIRQTVQESEETLDREAAYIVYLCDRALDLLDGEDVDLFALRSISYELSGVSLHVGARMDEKRQKKLWNGCGKVLSLWVRDFVVQTAVEITASNVAGLISGE